MSLYIKRNDSNSIKKSCDTCEFNFGDVCASHGIRLDNGEDTYGMSINDTEKMFPNGCYDWGISLDAFITYEKLNGR